MRPFFNTLLRVKIPTMSTMQPTMNSIISLATKHLEDPLVLEWALERYLEIPKAEPDRRQQIIAAVFHDLTLQRCLDVDHAWLTSRLLRELPEHCFANLKPTLLKLWEQGSPSIMSAVSLILANVDPEKWSSLMEQHLQDIEQHRERPRVEALSQWHQIKAEPVSARLAGWVNRLAVWLLQDRPEHLDRMMLVNYLPRLALQLEDHTLDAVLDASLQSSKEEFVPDKLLCSLFRGLFGRDSLLDLVLAKARSESEQSLVSLSPWFEPGTPLEQWEAWLSHTPEASELASLLKTYGQNSEGCQRLSRLLAPDAALRQYLDPDEVCQITVAALLEASLLTDFSPAGLSLAVTLELLAADLKENPWKIILSQHLLSFDINESRQALSHRLTQKDENYGSSILAWAMGEIGEAAFIPTLIESMGEDKGDFLCEEAMRALAKIGVPAQEALISAWDSLDESQRIFGIGVIEPVGGSGAIEFALDHFDRLIMSNTDLFCGLLEAVPDPRLLGRLKQVLHEQSPLIDQAYYLQARLLGSDDPEVEVVHQRVLAERERVSRTMMSFEAGKSEPGPMILKLRCPACGAEHRYPTLGVVVPPSQTEGIPYLIADEYPCKSCHAWVEFEFTQEAYGRLIPESFSLLTQPGQDLSDIRVKPMSCRLDNEVVPMALALQRLRERLAANPDDWVSHLKLGLILPALNRPQAAVTHLLPVIRQHPKAVDVVTLLASQLMRLGEMGQALTHLQTALACPGVWERYTPNGPGNRDFVDLYNELRRQLNRHDLPALHPSALEPPAKVGRNDPCPCGSGKKYKKCCLD
jgi:hypothetical protein